MGFYSWLRWLRSFFGRDISEKGGDLTKSEVSLPWKKTSIYIKFSILLVLKKTTNEYYYDSSTKQIIIPPIFSPFEYIGKIRF